MTSHLLHRTFTAFLLIFAYVLLLVHNLVPHHHPTDAAHASHHQAAAAPQHHHQDHHHGHSHGHGHNGETDADKPLADPNPFLSDHQHAFADNKVYHVDSQPGSKAVKKQTFPVLAYLLSPHDQLFCLPGKIPDPPAYSFPSTHLSRRSHALRGPPVG